MCSAEHPILVLEIMPKYIKVETYEHRRLHVLVVLDKWRSPRGFYWGGIRYITNMTENTVRCYSTPQVIVTVIV